MKAETRACTHITPIAVIVGAAAVTAAAVIGALTQATPDSGFVAGEMSTGVTVTATNPPSEVSVPEAIPTITGPAPLPKEEQGLPG